jgi:hypothetical protein
MAPINHERSSPLIAHVVIFPSNGGFISTVSLGEGTSVIGARHVPYVAMTQAIALDAAIQAIRKLLEEVLDRQVYPYIDLRANGIASGLSNSPNDDTRA